MVYQPSSSENFDQSFSPEAESNPTIEAIEQASLEKQIQQQNAERLTDEAAEAGDDIAPQGQAPQQQLSQSQASQEAAQAEAEAEAAAEDEEDEDEAEEEETRKQAQMAKQKLFAQNLEKDAETPPYKMSLGWGLVALIILAPLDLFIFVTGWIPVLGQILSAIVKFIGLLIRIAIHIFDGGKFDKRTIKNFSATGAIGLMPIFNMLPNLTGSVIISMIGPKIEEKAATIAHTVGGEDLEKKLKA